MNRINNKLTTHASTFKILVFGMQKAVLLLFLKTNISRRGILPVFNLSNLNKITFCMREPQDFRERPGCRPRPTQWGLCSSITHPKVTCHKQAKPVSFIYCSLVNLHFLQHRRTDTKWIKFVTKDELQCLKVFYISQSHPILTVISELR